MAGAKNPNDPWVDDFQRLIWRFQEDIATWEKRIEALTGLITCPACDAPPGRKCANLNLRRRVKEPVPDQPVKHPHARRVEAYEAWSHPGPEDICLRCGLRGRHGKGCGIPLPERPEPPKPTQEQIDKWNEDEPIRRRKRELWKQRQRDEEDRLDSIGDKR